MLFQGTVDGLEGQTAAFASEKSHRGRVWFMRQAASSAMPVCLHVVDDLREVGAEHLQQLVETRRRAGRFVFRGHASSELLERNSPRPRALCNMLLKFLLLADVPEERHARVFVLSERAREEAEYS